MNIHPLFVHFPIALLSLYVIAELLRFKKLQQLSFWSYVKAFLVIVGTIGAFFALATGDQAASYHRDVRQLVGWHETWADMTTWLFAVLSLNYLFILAVDFFGQRLSDQIKNLLLRLISFYKTWLVIILSLMGLVSVTITGALGGAIVYGPEVDPIVSFIYHLFF